MHKKMLAVVLFLYFGALNVWAAATVQSRSGDVRFETAGRASAELSLNQRLDAGATVQTGPNGQALLRFDDGQMVAVSGNSSFKVEEFRFDKARPELGRVAFSLFRGALRLVTGLVGQRNPSQFSLSTPTATIGVRGTDFMVALVNPVYLSVSQGAITAANTVGAVGFSAGSTGMVASATVLPFSIAASALPAAVSATFSQLSALSMAAAAPTASAGSGGSGAGGGAGSGAAGGAGGTGGAGASAATTGAVGGVGAGTVSAAVAAAATLAVAVSGSTGTAGTTGTQ